MSEHAHLSPGALGARLLTEAPVAPLVPVRSDFDLNPSARPRRSGRLMPAAVLIPVVAHPEPTVLFTQRSASLSRHAGQVSFPGGRADSGDESLVETALRELTEETGIDADFVTVAGFLEPYETVTEFAVLPVVGIVRPGFQLAPDANEVEAVFEVPLDFLLDPANCRVEQIERDGRKRQVYAFHHETHYIWGATAAILVALAERLR